MSVLAISSGLTMHAVPWAVVLCMSLVAAVFDLAVRRIPNLLTGPMVLAGLAWSTWAGGLGGLAGAIVAGVLLLLPFALLFVFAHGGAGDAKLMAAVGVWLGLRSGMAALVAVMLAGLVLAVAFSLRHKRLSTVLSNVQFLFWSWIAAAACRQRPTQGPPKDMQTMPYGLAIFVGLCAAAIGVWVWPGT